MIKKTAFKRVKSYKRRSPTGKPIHVREHKRSSKETKRLAPGSLKVYTVFIESVHRGFTVVSRSKNRVERILAKEYPGQKIKFVSEKLLVEGVLDEYDLLPL